MHQRKLKLPAREHDARLNMGNHVRKQFTRLKRGQQGRMSTCCVVYGGPFFERGIGLGVDRVGFEVVGLHGVPAHLALVTQNVY